MVPEILKYLEVSSGGRYIDCTLGEGGHTRILEAIILEESTRVDADHETIEL